MRTGIAFSTAAAVALLAPTTAPTAAAATAPPLVRGPAGATVEITFTSGSGCAPGTAALALSDDKEAFSVAYTDFTAQAGGTSKPEDARKTCWVSVKIGAPDGFTFAISQVDYRMRGKLQAGAKGTHRTSHYFVSNSMPRAIAFDVFGPYDDQYQVTDNVPEDQLAWRPCGDTRNLNIATDLRVALGSSDPSKASSMTMNSADGNRTIYHFSWKRCP